MIVVFPDHTHLPLQYLGHEYVTNDNRDTALLTFDIYDILFNVKENLYLLEMVD